MQPFSEVPIKPDVSGTVEMPEANVDRPDETEGWKNSIELPDDTGEWVDSIELPEDSDGWQDSIELPYSAGGHHIDLQGDVVGEHSQEIYQIPDRKMTLDSQLQTTPDRTDEVTDSSNCITIDKACTGKDTDDQTDGKPKNINDVGNPPAEFSDLNSMKKELGKTYSEIKEDKPLNSPNISKWFESGGTIRVEKNDGKQAWTYTDSEGKSVQYIDGKVKFPPEAKHPIIEDISIGEFTGDRNKDKSMYLKKLEEEYGLTEKPDGYALHHDVENGVMQLVRDDYHKEFTHAGGHSMYKEDE